MDYPKSDDSFLLTLVVLRAVCTALPQAQRARIADSLQAEAEHLNESAQDGPSQFAALSLSALAAVTRDDPAAGAALFRAAKPR